MNEKEIMEKIAEVEEELKLHKISLISAPDYLHLLKIHDLLWTLAYFKRHLEKTFMLK